jgi:rhodanese-related sulfurtransferase
MFVNATTVNNFDDEHNDDNDNDDDNDRNMNTTDDERMEDEYEYRVMVSSQQSGITGNDDRRVLVRRQCIGLCCLSTIAWGLFYRQQSQSSYRTSNSHGHGPLPNGMSPESQQWLRASTKGNKSGGSGSSSGTGISISTTLPPVIPVMDPDKLHRGIQQGLFDMILDVRRPSEWDQGHYPNATFVMNLADQALEDIPSLVGEACMRRSCENVVVYCHSGVRAKQAITNMLEAGFEGRLVNGQGVKQYQAAGFSLVHTASVTPRCWNNRYEEEQEDEEELSC